MYFCDKYQIYIKVVVLDFIRFREIPFFFFFGSIKKIIIKYVINIMHIHFYITPFPISTRPRADIVISGGYRVRYEKGHVSFSIYISYMHINSRSTFETKQ